MSPQGRGLGMGGRDMLLLDDKEGQMDLITRV